MSIRRRERSLYATSSFCFEFPVLFGCRAVECFVFGKGEGKMGREGDTHNVFFFFFWASESLVWPKVKRGETLVVVAFKRLGYLSALSLMIGDGWVSAL